MLLPGRRSCGTSVICPVFPAMPGPPLPPRCSFRLSAFPPDPALPPLPAAFCPLPALPSKQEPEPMGTAGPLALARDILYNETNTPFFVLNRWGGAGSGAGAGWV